MSTPLPTLSTSGFVYQPIEKIDFLLAHFFYSDKAQSSLYGTSVANLQAILEKNSGSMDNTASDVQNSLQSYLQKHFDAVSVNVRYSEEDPDKSASRIDLKINIVVTVNQIEYEVTKMIKTIDGKFKEFISLNNEG